MTWDDTGVFSEHTVPNAYQLQIIDQGSGDFDLIYRYENITWTKGDGYTINASAGFSAGNGSTFFQVPGTGATGDDTAVATLDTTPGNTGVPGVWEWHIRDGVVVTPSGATSAPATVTVNVAAVNDAAVITGTSTASLTETDAVLTASGNLDATDVDGSAAFVAQTDVAGSNGFGTFSIDDTGAWTYTTDPSAHDEFVAGTTYTDSITVATADGTTQVITVSIAGHQRRGGDHRHEHGEPDGNRRGSDRERQPGRHRRRRLGRLRGADRRCRQQRLRHVLDRRHGRWTYTTAPSAHDEFVAGTTYTDSITVATADGTTQVITVSILGTNDAAVITGTSTASLTRNRRGSDRERQPGRHRRLTARPPSWRRPTWPAATATAPSRSTTRAPGPTRPLHRLTTSSWPAPPTPTASRWRRPTARRRSSPSASLGTNDAAVITGTSTASLTETDAVLTRRAATWTPPTLTARPPSWRRPRGRQQRLRHVLASTHGRLDLHDRSFGSRRVRGRHHLHRQHHGCDGRRHDAGHHRQHPGTNDAAVITGTSTASLTETDAVLTASGNLDATDVDGSAAFVAQTGVAGSNGFGTFSIDDTGAWTYTTDPSAHDEFVAGTTYTDSITVATADGTTQVITVSIRAPTTRR